jgi:predicted nucleic acid-binding protein
MGYLFDADAISEVLKARPSRRYVEWLATVPRAEQHCSAVSVGELFRGAFRSPGRERHLANIQERVLPAVTILPYDAATAREYGRIAALLESQGRRLADADLQIAATALQHGLRLVTGNVRHFERVPDLEIERVLAHERPRP